MILVENLLAASDLQRVLHVYVGVGHWDAAGREGYTGGVQRQDGTMLWEVYVL